MAKQRRRPDTNEVATLRKDYELFAGYFSSMQNPDKVLRLEAAGDISVYDDIGRDAHVASVLRTRARAVVAKEWTVEPASDKAEDVQVAEFVEQAFKAFPYDAARRALLRGGILKGYAVGEVMWEVSEGDVWIRKILPRAQRRFRFDWDGRPRLLTTGNMVDGEELPERKFQVFTFGDEPETPYGVGLGRELYWPWWFKKHGIKFWLVFCDRFGQPTPWGKYPAGASDREKRTLLDALGAIQTDGAIITPENMSVELLEAARAGSVDSYEKLCSFMNKEISKSVLGQTATTEGTPGKLGNEDAQQDVREDLLKDDADGLCEAQNGPDGLVRWLCDYNFPGLKAYPRIWIDAEPPEDLAALAERDERLSKLVPIPRSYFYERYSLPEPKAGEEVATAAPAAPKPPSPLAGEGGGEGAAFAESGAITDDPELDAIAQAMLGEWEPKMADVLDPIRQAVENAGNFEEARAALAAVQISPAKLTEALARAMFLARAAGDVGAGGA